MRVSKRVRKRRRLSSGGSDTATAAAAAAAVAAAEGDAAAADDGEDEAARLAAAVGTPASFSAPTPAYSVSNMFSPSAFGIAPLNAAFSPSLITAAAMEPSSPLLPMQTPPAGALSARTLVAVPPSPTTHRIPETAEESDAAEVLQAISTPQPIAPTPDAPTPGPGTGMTPGPPGGGAGDDGPPSLASIARVRAKAASLQPSATSPLVCMVLDEDGLRARGAFDGAAEGDDAVNVRLARVCETMNGLGALAPDAVAEPHAPGQRCLMWQFETYPAAMMALERLVDAHPWLRHSPALPDCGCVYMVTLSSRQQDGDVRAAVQNPAAFDRAFDQMKMRYYLNTR